MNEPQNIRLRPFQSNDADAQYLLLADGRVSPTTATIPFPYHEHHARAWIQSVLDQQSTSGKYRVQAIECLDTAKLVGVISVQDIEHRIGNVAYWIGPSYWGKGFATEALRLAVNQEWIDSQQSIWNQVANSVNFTLKPDLELFASQVPLDGSILDYGCGYGRVCNDLHTHGYKKVLGIDTSAEMIARGSLTYPHISLLHVSDYLIPFQANHFDGVIVCAVLTCISQRSHRRKVIEEIARVLKPGGIAYFLEFHISESVDYDVDGTFFSSLGIRMKHFTNREIEDELSSLDLINLTVRPAETLAGEKTHAIHCCATKL